MNSKLIEKIIKTNNEACPPFTYKNPLLDKNVAAALSRSFVKMLSLSKQNSNINNNLRLSILENIRKMCQIEPENHLKVDENFTELLTKFYDMQIQDNSKNTTDSTDKQLDAFLLRKLKEIDINSSFESSVNPEIVQALINLNENGVYLDILSNDIIHWNMKKSVYNALLKDLWSDFPQETTQDYNGYYKYNDVSIKMKTEIEKLLLETCHNVLLADNDILMDDVIVSNEFVFKLVKSCANSSECFQICCGILNFLFIMTNFDKKIQKFTMTFVRHVKENCPLMSFSVLYPLHLSSTVVLLDIAINEMLSGLKDQYIKFTLKYLKQLHNDSENDFILLLSHFPDWFDIYFSHDNVTDMQD